MGKQRYRQWSVRMVVIKLSRKLTATYRIRSDRSLSRLLSTLLALVSPLSMAELPTGLNVVAGQATVTTPTANNMHINQATDKAVLNWQTFNIGSGQSVHFIQPAATSVALNRVVGNEASSIYGSLTANGQVFLINPSGVMFAPGAQVSVGGLVASSLAISNEDFAAGRYTFSGNGGSVNNQGNINAVNGGYVLLAAPTVNNSGSITANGGSVALVAGSRATIDTSGTGLVKFSVDAAAAQAAIANSGSIVADGGQVALLASSVGDALATVVNHTGVIRANSAVERNGMIVLSGGASGVVDVSGTLMASGSATGLSGGTVKVLGDKVGLTGAARIDASGDAGGGTVLVGGNYQGAGPEQNASAAFVGADVRIAADGLQAGKGGTVVVWADESTRFNGAISARGGSLGGDGGLVETSGKEFLAAAGSVDASAVNGSGGTWLLDPSDVSIVNATSNAGAFASNVFTPTADNATADRNAIQTALNGGTSVTITTGATGSQAGNITVLDSITKSSGGAASLTLTAAGSIFVNNAVSSSSNALSVNLNATAATSFSGAGSLTTNGGNVAITGISKTLGDINTTGTTGTGNLTVSGVGAITQTSGALVIKGATTLAAGMGNDITLNAATNNFATLGVTSGKDVSITDANALQLGASTVASSLNVNAGGSVTQTGVVIAPVLTATLTGAASALTLGSANNIGQLGAITTPGGFTLTNGNNATSIAGAITSTNTAVAITTGTGATTFGAGGSITSGGGNVTLTNSNIAKVLGNIDTTGGAATGNLTITGAGVISQDTGTVLKVKGTTTITAGAANNVTLTNSGNDFGTVSVVSGKDVAITDSNALQLGTSTIAGTLDVNAGGAISQTTGALIVTGATTLAAGAANNITLGTATNNFSSVTVTSGKDVTLRDANALVLGASSVSGKLAVTTAGTITQSGALSVGDTTSLTAGAANDITLADAGNDFRGAVSVVSGHHLNLNDVNALSLGAISTTGANNADGGNVKITAGGAVSAAGTITTDGGTAVAASGRTAGNVEITGSGLTLAAISSKGSAGVGTNQAGGTAGSITLDAGTGTVTLGGNLTATGGNATGTAASGAGGNITVKNNALLNAAVTVASQGGTVGTAGAGGNIQFDGTLNSTGVARALTVTAGTGDVTLAGASGAASALASLSITANDISVAAIGGAAAGVTGATSLTATTATATADIGTITLGGQVRTGGLTLVSGDAITQSDALIVSGTTSITAGTANDITLSNTGNDFTGAVSVISGKNVSLTDSNALQLGASTVASSLNINAGGSVTQTGVVVAPVLTATLTGAASALTLGSANNIGQLGAITTPGGFTLTNGNNTVAINGAITSTNTGVSIASGSAATTFGAVGSITSGGGLVTLTNTNVSKVLGNIDTTGGAATGNLTLTGAGVISQDTGTALKVKGTTTITAGAANNVTLTNSGNDFGTVSVVSGKDVTITDTNALQLGAITTTGASNADGGNVTIVAGGAVTVSGAITTSGGTVTAGNAGRKAGDVNITAAGITTSSTITTNGSNGLGTDQAGGNAGAITLDATGVTPVITLGGNLSATGGNATGMGISGIGGAIALKDNTLLSAAVTLTSRGGTAGAGGNVDFSGTVDSTGAARALTITAGTGDVTIAGATGASSALSSLTVTANDINVAAIGSAAAGVSGTTSLTAATANTDIGTIALGGQVRAGGLTLASGDAITQSGALIVSGTTSITAGTANDVTLVNSGNDFGTLAVVSGKNVSLTDSNALQLGASTIAGTLDVNAGGAISQTTGALIVTGATTLAAGAANNITLGTATNNFSSVTVTSGKDVTLRDANALVLGASSVSGKLAVTTAGTITQSGALSVGDTTSLTAGAANDITLADAGNDFTNAVSVVSGRNVSLTDSNALQLGTSAVAGTLDVNAGGAITQTTGALIVTGATTLAAGAGNDITLTTATNNFSSLGITSGRDVAVRDTNGITLAASTIGRNLAVTTAGSVIQTGALNVAGTTTLAATGTTTDVALSNAGNDFVGAVAVTSGRNTVLTDANALVLGTSAVTGTLAVNTGGAITQTGAVIVTGVTTLAAGTGNDIELTNTGNNFATVGVSSGKDVALTDLNGIILGASNVASSLTVKAGGVISQAAGSAIIAPVLNAATYSAGSAITLGNAGNDANTVDLQVRGGMVTAPGAGNVNAAITYTDANAVDVASINSGTSGTAGAVTLLAGGPITQSGAIKASTLTVTTANVAGAAITLNDAGNDVATLNLQARAGTVAVVGNVNSGAAIGYTDANGFAVAGINNGTSGAAGNVTLAAGGIVTQGNGAALTLNAASLTAALTGASSSLTLGNTSGNNITQLGAITTPGGFTLTNGNNTVAINGAITSTNTGVSIASGSAATTFGAVGSITSGGGLVTLTNTNVSKVLGNIDTTGGAATGNLTLTGAGVISQDTGTVLKVKGTTTITAGAANNVTLTNSGNDFGTVSVVSGKDVAITDSNALQLGVSTVSGTLNVDTSGAITQSGALAVTGATTLSAGAGNDITLTTATNKFSSLGITSGRDVAVRDTNGITLAASTVANSLSVTAGGAIIQSGAITAPTLNAKTLINAGAAITLDNSANEVTTVSLLSRNLADTANAVGAISYRDATGFDIAAISTTGALTLRSSGSISQSGVISAASMGITGTGTGAVDLGTQANSIGTLNAITAAGGFALNNGNSNVTVAGNINATNSAVVISAGTGSYTQSNNVDVVAGTGNITVVADTVNIGTNVTGSDAFSTSGTLTLKPKTAGRAMSLAGSSAFDISAAEMTAFASGVSGPLVIGDTASTGVLTIGAALAMAGKTLVLNGGSITDGGGTTKTITAQNLTLNANGQIGLSAVDGIDVVAANLSVSTTGGGNAFVRTGAINLGVGSTAGANVGGTLDLLATGAVTQTADTGNVTAGTLKVKTLNDAGAAITLANTGNNAATVNLQSRNAVDSANAAGAVEFTDTNGFDVAAVSSTGNATLSAGGVVTQSGAIAASGLALLGTGGAYTLGNAGNAVTTLAANTGSIDYKQTTALAIGTVGVTGVSTTGAAKIETTGAGSNLTLNNAVTSSATGDAIILKAGSSKATSSIPADVLNSGHLVNNVGAAGIVASAGRYLVYSDHPDTTTEGVTGYSKRYNSDASYVPTGTASTFLYRIAPTLTVAVDSTSRSYGNSNPVFTGTSGGYIDGDTAASVGVSFTSTATERTAVAAGPVAINAAVVNKENYIYVAPAAGALTITRRDLVAGASGVDKVYDGTAAATVKLTDNRVAGDTLALANTSASFANGDVGTAKTVTVNGISLSGADAANYNLVNTNAATTANILRPGGGTFANVQLATAMAAPFVALEKTACAGGAGSAGDAGGGSDSGQGPGEAQTPGGSRATANRLGLGGGSCN